MRDAVMRVAMIHTPFVARSGGERQILRLAIELQKMGHEVEIFTNGINKETYPEYFSKVKINVVAHPFEGSLPISMLPQMAQAKIRQTQEEPPSKSKGGRLTQKMLRFVLSQHYVNTIPAMLEIGRKIPKGFDIINNHNFPTEWAGFFAKNRLKIPVVWMCNEPPFWFFATDKSRFRNINWPVFELLDKTAVRYIDDIMVLSHVAEGYVTKAYSRPSKVVRTGVDTELFHNAKGGIVRRKFNLEKCFVLLFVGSSHYAKRSDMIRALAFLSKKYHNVRLILDTSRELDKLIDLSEELGVKDKVILVNSRSDSELAEIYAACDVFVFPSSASTWGLVVTEAMAAAKPVIVSKQVGASEIIENYVNGIVIDRLTPEKIAEQVETLMNDSKLRKKIGENAYVYVRENLSWEKYAKTVESIFQEAIAKSKNK